jgi:hypothetical protein
MNPMKYVISVLALLCGVGLFFIKQVTFVPFKITTSPIQTITSSNMVTLTPYYNTLKRRYPNIQRISSIQQLKNHQIIVLPWNTQHENLQFLPLNGHAFFDSEQGAIQLRALKFKSDGYSAMLNNRVKLTAAGTVVLARGVHKVIQRENNIGFPWAGTAPLFKASDINMVNFKSPVVAQFEYPSSSWVLVGKSIYVQGMASANIHVVSVSGNHMGDAGISGFTETMRHLDRHNILYVGGGHSVDEAYGCKKIMKKNISFGVMAFNNVPGSIGRPNDQRPGIAWLDESSLAYIKKCKDTVDQLVVMVNWGTEYTHHPRDSEQRWAKKMVESGADLILGDQAHWVQKYEKINGNHVSYGLGNFIFDQHWSVNTTEGIIQHFIFYNNSILAVDTIPIKLQPNGNVVPIPTESNRYQAVLGAYYQPLDAISN